MILQALVRLYDDLAEQGKISPLGWSAAKVGVALCLNAEGEIVQVIPLKEEVAEKGKTKLVDQTAVLPISPTRSSGIRAVFLWDTSKYILGIDKGQTDKRATACLEACRRLHEELLNAVDCVEARAILNFFHKWDPSMYEGCEALHACREAIDGGANLVFRVNGVYPHKVPEIRAAWQARYDHRVGTVMQCLITGEEDTIELTHPLIRGIYGAQSSGAALVSFNADSFCSYGYNGEQGLNAPVGHRAAFAYTTALQHLINDKDNVHRIGDTTVLCWAEGAKTEGRDLFFEALFGNGTSETFSEEDLRRYVKKLADGLPCEELSVDPDCPFYILGIAPNAARLSVRFFLQTTFGQLMRNVNDHHERCEIVGKRYDILPLWAMLRETVNMNTTDKTPNPVMAGAVARAVFEGTRYPASLLMGVLLRIRAEREITPGRAAILKAYYLKNPDIRCPKEVLTVSLNEQSTNIPYTIGRLFAVYEAIQEEANPGINATIKDKYFNAVAATPAYILPILANLSQKHLRKLQPGRRIWYDKQITAILSILGETYPARLSLPEQGSFYLGYYHQKEKRFEKKENQ